MTTIWKQDGAAWQLVSPSWFPAEAALHELVEKAPSMLPLAGAPQLEIVGREVLLGGNWADLIAIESTGRLAIIEIKLSRNSEARRAVVAQVLTYAAFLRGLDQATVEREILAPHLAQRGYASLADAILAIDQTGAFDVATFATGLSESLRLGQFRLVLVLDEAPPELVRLVGYLEAVTEKLVIDLVTVSAYDIDGSQIVVPQRVGTEREPTPEPVPTAGKTDAGGRLVQGTDDFVATIEQNPAEQQPLLRHLVDWAIDLEAQGLARLSTYHGRSNRTTLLPRIPGEDVGLVTIWNDNGPYISLWRSVFLRRAPRCLEALEKLPGAPKIGQGTTTKQITEELLTLLTAAYREAVTGEVLSTGTTHE